MDFWRFINISEQVASFISSILQETPFKKNAKTEIETAIMIGEDISSESNPRDGLIRMLVHLETAVIAYSKSVGTWNIWDYDRVVWRQLELYNKLCILIAIIHKQLGNQELVKKWLIEIMSEKGPWRISVNIDKKLDGLCLPSSLVFDETFYQMLLGDDFDSFIEGIIKPSDDHYKSSVDYAPDDYHPETAWIYQP